MFHALAAAAVLDTLASARSGLESDAIDELREKHGWNELPRKKRSAVKLLLGQFNDVLVYILLGALALSAGLRVLEGAESAEQSIDIVAIVAILVLNALLGFVQEYRAERELEGLQKLTAPQVRVRRSGGEFLLPSRELLPGDIVIIEAGDRIAADGRLVSVAHLEMNESSLTGESAATHKEDVVIKENAPLAERKNFVFAGTLVTRGSAEYVVTAIGVRTEIGKIATMVAAAKTPPTPLETRMKRFSGIVGVAVVGLCAALAALQYWRGEPLIAVFMLAISLAVSAVPEGLPAVVTASLAMGVRRMVKRNAIVRRLDALETLGGITVICTDKTGTVTENRMKVVDTWLADGVDERDLIEAAASCNRAQLPRLGDPTEIGLLEYAQKMNVERLPIADEEVPFTSEEKYMRTSHEKGSGDGVPRVVSYLKGAPEKIAVLCALTSDHPLFDANGRFANEGLRVLGVAMSEHGKTPTFLGLVAMEDPPRAGVEKALKEALFAGIRTVMITGDNVDTASAIARRVGIEGKAIEGAALDGWSPERLRDEVKNISVYARVSPEHKIAICKALQSNGEVVAMTGDGVNDAPALKAAHVGVSMGKDGTQVAREAASLILADDDYSTIVSAIREGRRIYDNIRKFVLYLVQANVAQLMLITVTVIMGLPLPLLPLHILWINLMTDGLPALALGMEKEEAGIMRRPPRSLKEGLFAGDLGRLALSSSAVCGLTLIVFLWALNAYDDLAHVRGVTFTFSIIIELLLAFYSRSSRTIFRIGFLTNPWLVAAAAVPLLLQIPLLYTPLRFAFEIAPLRAFEVALVMLTAAAGFLFLELTKPAVARRRG